MIHFDDTQNSVSKVTESTIVEDSDRKQQKWILTLLNLYGRYKINMFVSLYLSILLILIILN
uniref:ABC transporter ATP-binding protein n=1 Tax=Elaeophora elaphi TaxID=1147741 RepID=A0A0R3RZ25_9BILA